MEISVNNKCLYERARLFLFRFSRSAHDHLTSLRKTLKIAFAMIMHKKKTFYKNTKCVFEIFMR